VERIGQTGAVSGPSVSDITTPMQNAVRLGLPAPPMFASSAGSLQSVLIEWWLAYRSGDQVGPDRMLPAGDFVPVRTADNRRGAIVFYPGGNPGPLRDHLTLGAALPADYATATLGFREVPITPDGALLQWQAVLNDLPSLATWEAANGPATDGFLLTGTGLGTAGWLGGPIPPSIVDRTARAAYARCNPGASPPATGVEIHSPVRIDIADGSGVFALPGSGRGAVTYVVPRESTKLKLIGTASGTATVVARTDETVRSYTFMARKGASGDLSLTAGAATRLTFAGRSIPATSGVALRMVGSPRSVKAGQVNKVRVRVTDALGSAVPMATVTARGAGTAMSGRTDDRGLVTLILRPKARGSVTLVASAPAARPARLSVASR